MDGFYREKIIKRFIKYRKLNGSGCYIWNGNVSKQGYGTTHIFGKIYLVHRLSVLLFKDLELDSEIYVQHTCENRLCFNPDHLKVKIN